MEEGDSAPPPSGVHFADPVKLTAGATRANENIPNSRHRVETELEEQSLWSSFLTFFSIQYSADRGPKLNVCEQKVETCGVRKLPCAGPAVHRQKVRQFGRERAEARWRTEGRSAQLWSVHRPTSGTAVFGGYRLTFNKVRSDELGNAILGAPTIRPTACGAFLLDCFH